MRLIFLLPGLLLALNAAASTWYGVTVTVTNAPSAGATLTINGDVRTWASPVTSAATEILTGTNVATAAQNLWLHINAHSFSGLSLSGHSTNSVTIQTALDGTAPAAELSAGWGTVVISTNTLTAATVVRVPLEVESPAQRTNIASQLGAILNSGVNTNPVVVSKPTLTDTLAVELLGLTSGTNFTKSFSVTNSPVTNSILGWLSIAISGTNYYIPLCSTNGL